MDAKRVKKDLDRHYGERGRYPRKMDPVLVKPADTPKNRKILADVKRAVSDAHNQIMAIGVAISDIKALNLWMLTPWPTFEVYLDRELGIDARQARRYMAAPAVIRELESDVKMGGRADRTVRGIPQINALNFETIKALGRAPEGRRLEAVRRAANTEHGITGRTIADAVRAITRKRPELPATGTDEDLEADDLDGEENATAAAPASVAGHPALVAGEKVIGAVNRIMQACGELASFMGSEYSALAPAGQPVEQIRRLAKSIQAAAPYSLCGCDGGCDACGQRGWIRKLDFDQREKRKK